MFPDFQRLECIHSIRRSRRRTFPQYIFTYLSAGRIWEPAHKSPFAKLSTVQWISVTRDHDLRTGFKLTIHALLDFVYLWIITVISRRIVCTHWNPIESLKIIIVFKFPLWTYVIEFNMPRRFKRCKYGWMWMDISNR